MVLPKLEVKIVEKEKNFNFYIIVRILRDDVLSKTLQISVFENAYFLLKITQFQRRILTFSTFNCRNVYPWKLNHFIFMVFWFNLTLV